MCPTNPLSPRGRTGPLADTPDAEIAGRAATGSLSCPLVTLGALSGRTRPLRGPLDEVALIVGLGQVGMQAATRLHAMLGAMLPARDVQAQVRLLGIARRRSIRDDSALPRASRLLLGLDPVAWSAVPGRYANQGVAAWWPRSPRKRELIEDPTATRAYGRLLLFENAALVNETLLRLVQWLDDAGAGLNRTVTRRIYLLASLAEPESSGMVFDVATRLRMLPARKASTTVGVFSLRDDELDDDTNHTHAMANVYAALREIDAYTLHPDAYPSALPATGYTLTERTGRRALDLILLADDAAAASEMPPEAALAEGVAVWLAASQGATAQAGALPVPVEADESERFAGYTTMGISKLALPTQAVQRVGAARLAISALEALKATRATTPTGRWVHQVAGAARVGLLGLNSEQTGQLGDRLRRWQFDLSAAGLVRTLEARAARGESDRMQDAVQAEVRRLERESFGENPVDQAAISRNPDSLRHGVDAALTARLREIRASLLASPSELAYARGLGLIWALSALDELEAQIAKTLPEFQNLLAEAEAAFLVRRGELFERAGQYDSRIGRFGSNRKSILADLDEAARVTLQAVYNLVLAQARLDAWQDLREMAGTLRESVREAVALVDAGIERLRQGEAVCRAALDAAVDQPPRFPAAAVLTRGWLADALAGADALLSQPPETLLGQIYAAWEPGELPPERRLVRFLEDIGAASRRVLGARADLRDLHTVLAEDDPQGAYAQALADLPAAATPALVPVTDGEQSPPRPYELVFEMSRPLSPVRPAQTGVLRLTVPSPDPDAIVVLRMLHGLAAESLPALRDAYRRAYERAAAEGMPLHIDRRWDSTMADLAQNTARRQIGTLWEQMASTLPQGPEAARPHVEALIRLCGEALDVSQTAVAPHMPPDVRLAVYKLRPLQLKLPPPTCPILFVYSTRPPDQLGADLARAVTPLPLEEQFAFVVNANGRPDIEHIIDPLRRMNYTVVLLNEADLKHIVTARLPTVALGEHVLAQVRLTTVSPFFTRGPVPEHMYFGREREINEVRSKLRTHSVALIGGRRIGKTSTLQRIQRLLRPRESEYVPYYLDCHGATNYRTFFWLVNRRWKVQVDQDALPVQFEDVVTDLQQRHGGKAIVFLFDEIDSLLEFDRTPENHETLFRTFRSLSNEKRCQFVFSGEKWLMQATSNPYSALFNFAQIVRLHPLPHKVVHHLVADPFEMLNIWMEQPDQIVDRIYEISAGHPNIVQMICQSMVEELDAGAQNANLLSFEHLDRATSRRRLQEEIVQTIWGQMNSLARLITLIWPEGRRDLSLREIEELLRTAGLPHVPPERLERTARDLELYCFVRAVDNDRLQLIPVAFPAILDFMTDKQRQIEIVLRRYLADPEGRAG